MATKTKEMTYSILGQDIYLFGLGELSKTIAEFLSLKGCNVKAFVTSMRNIVENRTISVDEFLAIKDESTIIIICLQNGNEHIRVATDLQRKGVKKIIYLPMIYGSSLEYCHEMRKAYMTIQMRGNIETLRIPYSNCEITKSPEGLINCLGEQVVFWCDIDKIRVVQENSTEYIRLDNNTPYMDLFRYLNGENVSIETYLKWNRQLHPNVDEFIKDRRELFNIYEYAFNYDRQFFMDSPSNAKAVDDFFYLYNGCHRSTYLYFKGLCRVPIVCTLNDYQKVMG